MALGILPLPMKQVGTFGRATLLSAGNCSRVSEDLTNAIRFPAWRTSIFIFVLQANRRFDFIPRPESFILSREGWGRKVLSTTLFRLSSTYTFMG